ncbi:DUF2461 domain-containing protein [Odoribacter lunatus]|uniref:DUF2461 domain-containing protein n=1 Tax=Odoribacter lunatus TaxID=2941335 RepID=UPI00204157CA|nr:DUF2461 domain-containing protein [Odoribacter lunatus]
MERIFTFLRELRQHNNREWFNEHKPEFLVLKMEFEKWVQQLIDKIAEFDEELSRLEAKDCVYRIYRDTRFSPDKTPYKTHMAAYMCAPRGRSSDRAGYYVHLEPDNCLLGGGLYCPEPALLKRVRQDIYDNIEEFTGILRDKEFAKEFGELDREDMLKKVPAPFPADFPEGDLLKRKHYDIISRKPDDFFKGEEAINRITDVFRVMVPFHRFLNYTVDGEGEN